MPVRLYRVEVEASGKSQIEYLLCGVTGSPIRFLSGTVAGAVARYYKEKEAVVIDRARFEHWRKREDIEMEIKDVRLVRNEEQRDEARAVFDALLAEDGEWIVIGHLCLSPNLTAMSSTLHESPARALGIPEATWTSVP